MKTEHAVSLTEPVYEHILNMILNLELRPGDKVPETAIAKDLGISRTPVRDALRKLEGEGLVNIYPNRFVEVASFDESDIINLGIMRIAIDTMAVRLAIFRGSNEEFYHLKSIADKCTEAKDSGNRLERIRNDYLFHLTLGILSKNPVLEKYQTHLLRQMEVMLSYNTSMWYPPASDITRSLKQ
ncbi:GntR family transcriptional regulator [Clostridium sp. AM58-1XD]|uniref:GntR family transcriptional regulator n=1 Tax=Clostridium sp. AM58-1XD TaxID=2292307 RepID=UPI001FA937C5|nr:GntR family transcriptional regulator [Clostridium sp. AM58-1XD]